MKFENLPQEQFGDSPELADKLADLICRGVKTATCSVYDPERNDVNVGHRVVVLNSDCKPVCVIETVKVDKIPFNKVSKDFAYKEGEGDRSLESWREEHKRFFKKNGYFSEDMMLLCEEIKVIHVF